MSSVPKFLASVAVIMIAMIVCISLVFAGVLVTSARTYHNNIISEVEDSNFDENVISECIVKAAEKKYSVTITKEENISSVEYCKVKLHYDVYVPLFGKIHEGVLIGYAFPGAAIVEEVPEPEQFMEIDANGVLSIKPEYRWATGVAEYCSDSGDPAVAGSKNALLPSEILIPTYYNGVEVKELCKNMFVNCPNIIYLKFEEGIKVIGDNAFMNCPNITDQVILPDSLEVIGNKAFYNSGEAGKFFIGKGVQSIGEESFYNAGANGSRFYLLSDIAPVIGNGAFFADAGRSGISVYVKNTSVKGALSDGVNYKASQCSIIVDSGIAAP